MTILSEVVWKMANLSKQDGAVVGGRFDQNKNPNRNFIRCPVLIVVVKKVIDLVIRVILMVNWFTAKIAK